MFVIGNLLNALATVLGIALTVYMWIIIIDALLTWVNPDPYNPIVRFLRSATEPVVSPVRRVLFRYIPQTGIDFSPLVVILILIFLQIFVVNTLQEIALRLR
ncbi:MAG: YggT family protein [Desulfatibacillaceae bacterium]